MIVQEWGCDKCSFHYPSHVILKALEHHCGGSSLRVKPAKLLPHVAPKPAEIPRKVGRVLKRRANAVK